MRGGYLRSEHLIERLLASGMNSSLFLCHSLLCARKYRLTWACLSPILSNSGKLATAARLGSTTAFLRDTSLLYFTAKKMAYFFRQVQAKPR